MRQRLVLYPSLCGGHCLVPLAARGELPALSLPALPESSQDLGYIGDPSDPTQEPEVRQTLEPVPADEQYAIDTFRILNTATGVVEEVSVRDYVRGAVAAELPPAFIPKR